MIDAAHWQDRLDALAARHRVPGAALGILRTGAGGDEVAEAAYGVLNVATGVPATTDTLWQIGSITKVWTATLALQLADEGRLDLDAPVTDVLPDLRLADPAATARVTVRQLLTHTSGIDGDVFTDTGRGDDCIERYVARLGDVAQIHPPGATWSYCNTGFVLAGRVIEALTGGTWDEAVRTRLCAPLGLAHTATLPEDAMLHRVAIGHLAGPDGPVRAPVAMLPRSGGPAGLISASVADVLAFVRLHLTGGLAPDGARLLSGRAAAEMASHQADLPDRHTLGDSWGLGWIRMGWDGHRLVGHDGSTVGQSAYLRVLPAAGLAVTLLTNADNARDLYEDLFREIFAELAGVPVPQPLAPPAEPPAADVTPHLGRYERAGCRLDVRDGDDGPVLRIEITGELAPLAAQPVRETPLAPVAGDVFAVRQPESRVWSPVTFFALPTGQRYVHLGLRATPKAD